MKRAPVYPDLDPAVLDLGRDHERMTPGDSARQHATVQRLLEAFFGPSAQRRELQLLADEVGLGKTFVALAVAWATLAALRDVGSPLSAELRGAYRAVVVITPQGNHALAQKWSDEVGALVKRCGLQPERLEWFTAACCATPEDLLVALRKASDGRRRAGSVPTVLVCEAGIFSKRIRESGAKLRFLAAALFRWLGSKLPHETRRHVIRRAAAVSGFEDWTDNVRRGEPIELWDFDAHEEYLALPAESPERRNSDERRAFEAVPFRYKEMSTAFEKLAALPDGARAFFSDAIRSGMEEEPEGIVPYCKWIAAKVGKGEIYFNGFRERVSQLYRSLFTHLMSGTLPLVIADEAHHWRRNTTGCRNFRTYLAPFTHRLLLLTATPFQLHRDELAGIFDVGSDLARTMGRLRVDELRRHARSITVAMEISEAAGHAFSKSWGNLAGDLAACCPATSAHTVMDAARQTGAIRQFWQELKLQPGTLNEQLQALPGRLRPFFKAAVDLEAANRELSACMRVLVIRHRRETRHRRYRVGGEYARPMGEPLRPDQHQLHTAPGQSLPAEAELAQFLLMKVVASASRGRRKTALGMDCTGAYSTLWTSSEGRKAVQAGTSGEAASYAPLLQKFTGGAGAPTAMDGQHPKLKTVVERALHHWEGNEKMLIFCFRVPTAEALRRLIEEGIGKRLKGARRELLRGRSASRETAMAQFKKSLTSRTGSVLPAFMDRVLLGWAQLEGWDIPPFDQADLEGVAGLAARAYALDGKPAMRDLQHPDRVLLSRIAEHVLAQKLQRLQPAMDRTSDRLLQQIADVNWIESRYSIEHRTGGDCSDDDDDEAADVLTRSSLSARYRVQIAGHEGIRSSLLTSFLRAQEHGSGLLDTLIGGPNLFVPRLPFTLDAKAAHRAQEMTRFLWSITKSADEFAWMERSEVVDAVNRTLLRDHFLLRLPKSVFSEDDTRWSEALVQGFHSRVLFGASREPLAARVADFLDELTRMTSEEREHSLRYALNPLGQAVALVSGSNSCNRASVFRGFNGPLLPEILICTQVGQEGIDLHRHCRHVVHYDLGWNPATLEQRTGRVDRLGSKTQRERKLDEADHGGLDEAKLSGLEIGLPYLAATYDERMFDRLFARAQAFDLLTGGDPSAEADEAGQSELMNREGPLQNVQFVALPDEMREALRVNLTAPIQNA